MSNIAYELFFPYVQPQVPACPDPSLVMAIRNACIQFCEDTLFLNDTIDSVQAAVGNNLYDLDAPTGQTVSKIKRLFFDGRELFHKTPDELNGLYGVTDWQTTTGTPLFFTQLATDQFMLVPVPEATGSISGQVAYKPTRASTTVDSRLLEKYAEVIALGALARVYLQPDQPYTNPSNALAAGAMFSAGISNAKAYVRGGMDAATPMRVRFNRLS